MKFYKFSATYWVGAVNCNRTARGYVMANNDDDAKEKLDNEYDCGDNLWIEETDIIETYID